MTELLPVYHGRVMPNFDDEKSCGYGCTYCFATNREFYDDPLRPKSHSLAKVGELVKVTLESTGDKVDFVNSACSREVFEDEQEGLNHVRTLARFGEFKRNVSFPTKTALSDRAISELVALNEQLKQNGKKIAMQMSFVSGRERPELEKRTPPVQQRIDATRRITRAGMRVGAYIRPILPSSIVCTDEIFELVDQTEDHIDVYTIGAEFAFTDKIAARMNLPMDAPEIANHTKHNQSLPFAPSSPIWHIYNDPRAEEIMNSIRKRGKQAFSHAGDTLDFLVSRP